MKKKIFLGVILMVFCSFGVLSLNAANNRVKIVSENFKSNQLSNDGMHITNVINTAKTDLINGNVQIDIIIDNSKHTEIFYVIDNGMTMSSNKNTIIDAFKTSATTLEGIGNIKQGIVTTTNGTETFVDLDNTNIEMQLENIKSVTSSTTTDGEIFASIDKAATSFSETADNKIIIVNLASLGTLNTEQITALKTKIDNYTTSGIKIIVYGLNITDTTNFTNIFSSTTKYQIETSNISTLNFVANVSAYLPQVKSAIATTISFDNYILNNFSIKNIETNLGVAKFDESTNKIVWEVGNIGINQVAKLTYTLSLNSVVDESIVEKLTLRTNRQIIVTQSGVRIGNFPEDSQIDDQICCPTIMILKEAVDNPKTGVADYIIFGSCLFAVSTITLLVLNKKTSFNRI